MTKYKLLFPGQGSQTAEMVDFLLEVDNLRTTNIFTSAALVLGFDLLALIKNGGDELTQTFNAQPAILTTSYCAYLYTKEKLGISERDIVSAVGHSLGEYNCLLAAGSLTFAEALKIVRMRGLYMAGDLENSGNLRSGGYTPTQSIGGMCAVLTDIDTLNGAIEDAESKVEVANFNSPSQIVISGSDEEIDKFSLYMAEKHSSIKCVRLNVSAPFHSSLMAPAAEKFGAYLKQYNIVKPKFAVVNNVNADITDDPTQIRANLISHLTKQVKFVDCVKVLNELEPGEFLEVGHGKVLQSLVRRINREIKVTNFAEL